MWVKKAKGLRSFRDERDNKNPEACDAIQAEKKEYFVRFVLVKEGKAGLWSWDLVNARVCSVQISKRTRVEVS